MKVYRGAGPEPGDIRRPVVSIGTFDGMHRGHQAVIAQLIRRAEEWGGEPGIITFRYPPRRMVFHRDATEPRAAYPKLITSLDHRLMLFERQLLKWAWVMDFSVELSRMAPRDFVKKILVDQLNVIGAVMGFDNRFGFKGEGGPDTMRELGGEFGFKTDSVSRYAFDGLKISSSQIRSAILEGDLKTAEAMLGRRVSVYGKIVHGDGRGMAMDFPTANVAVTGEVLPPPGVYATISVIEDVARLQSVTNIGYRPTFSGDAAARDPIVETHLLDFHGNVYDTFIEVQFVEKIRAEKKFGTAAELADRIRGDIRLARGILETECSP